MKCRLPLIALLFFPLAAVLAEVPSRQAPSRDYSDEIDQAISEYISKAQKTGSVDHDDERIRRIFGDDRHSDEDEILQEEETVQFSNVGMPSMHVVQKGETLFAIARRYGLAPAELVRMNSFLNDRALFVGDRLALQDEKAIQKGTVNPPAAKVNPNTNAWKKREVVTYRIKKYTTKKGESLTSIARQHKLPVAELRRLNEMKKKDVIHPGQVLIVQKTRVTQHMKYRQFFLQPVDGNITSGFGRRRNPFVPSIFHFHKGIDIGAMIGKRFHVARDGIVVFSGRMQGYGNVVFVRHKDGYITVYGHNKLNLVKNGDVVRQGQEIGEVGRTGIATGPHLHFEVRKMDEIINPFVALKMQEVMQVSTETAHR